MNKSHKHTHTHTQCNWEREGKRGLCIENWIFNWFAKRKLIRECRWWGVGGSSVSASVANLKQWMTFWWWPVKIWTCTGNAQTHCAVYYFPLPGSGQGEQGVNESGSVYTHWRCCQQRWSLQMAKWKALGMCVCVCRCICSIPLLDLDSDYLTACWLFFRHFSPFFPSLIKLSESDKPDLVETGERSGELPSLRT